MKCNHCSKPIYDQDNIICSTCNKQYHFKCVGFHEDRFRKMRSSTKAIWAGPCCTQALHKLPDGIDLNIHMDCNASVSEANKQLVSTSTAANTFAELSPVSDTKTLNISSLHNLIKKEMETLREGNRSDLECFKHDILTYMDDKYKKQDEKIAQLSDILNNFRAELLNLNKRCSDIEDSCRFLSSQYDTLLEKHNNLDAEIKSMHNEIGILKSNDNVLEEVKLKINEQEQLSRSHNIEVFGIPEHSSENLPKIILDIAKFIGVELQASDIVFSKRIKPKQNISGLPKPIIVKLSSLLKRDQLISSIRKKKGCSSADLGIVGETRSIYLNEHLTIDNKKLFKATRKVCSDLGFSYSWVRNGKIFVRRNDTSPPVHIRTERDLSKLNEQKRMKR